MCLQHETQRLEYFLDCLVELRFGRILGLHLGHDFFNVIARNSGLGRRQRTCTHIENLLDL